MTVLDQDDDDMPPLEYVGTGAVPAPKTAPLAPKPAEEDDDDDDMPPLDYVGLTPGKAQEPEKRPKAATMPAEAADDDDMPALEYVGTGPGQSYCLREGSKVRLKGLSKADLNGQTGKILPFLNTTKDRLPVRLDSTGKNVSIKPDNLETVDAGPELTPEPRVGDEDSDDEMPPLEAAPAPKAPAPKGADAIPAAPEEEDDDDMPPLEHVGAAVPAAAEDDDDMPPLEYVGAAARPAPEGPSQPVPAALEEGVKQHIDWKEGDQVRLKGLSKTELNGQTGRVLSFTGPCPERLPLKLDDSGKKVAIKAVNLERLTPPAPQVEDDDDDMPPLEYVGTSASNQLVEAPAPKPAAPAAVEEEDDDDDMPPLEYVGTKPTASTQEDADDDDDMPPLEYVGTSKPSAPASFKEGDEVILKGLSKVELNGQRGKIMSSQGSAKDRLPVRLDATQQRLSVKPENLELAKEQEEDDEMPPLTYVGVGSAEAPPKPSANEEDDEDDDMPPLEYVGAPPGKAEADKDDTPVPPLEQESDGDMPPLEYVGTSGPEHTGPASRPAEKAPESTTLAGEDDDDDDMPPLEYVGTQQPQPSQVEDDDDMPPLEYVGSAPAKPSPSNPGFKEGDLVVLKGLSKVELNGQRGVVMPFSGEGQGGRLPVRLEASGQKVSIKPVNLEKRSPSAQIGGKEQPEDSEDDDDMPPLEYVGSAALPQAHVDADAGESVFREGDAVVLTGLAKADLNGQHGTVLPFLEKANGRLPVRLASGEKVSIKPENLEKTPSAAAAEQDGAMSDDSMPPLDYVGTAAPASQESSSRPPLLPRSPGEEEEVLRVGDTVVLSGLRTGGLNGERAKIVKEPDASEPRVQLKLLGTGKKLLVKWANISKAPNSESEEEEVSRRPEAPDAKASTTSRGAAETSKTPEELLELMRQAMQSTAVAPVVDALAQVEAAEGLDWGDLLPRKKHTLKKLRAKKRKLQPQDDEPPAQQLPETPERPPLPPAAPKGKATGRGEQDKSGSKRVEEDWVVLSGAASPNAPAAQPTARLVHTAEGPKAAPPSPPAPAAAVVQNVSILKQWCQDLQLPMEVLKVLEAEEVTDPQELTDVSEEELSQLTQGWKIGPKGRFMKAVRKMRALEQAEYGSTCGSLA